MKGIASEAVRKVFRERLEKFKPETWESIFEITLDGVYKLRRGDREIAPMYLEKLAKANELPVSEIFREIFLAAVSEEANEAKRLAAGDAEISGTADPRPAK